MSSSQCSSKPQPVLLHCERSTPADGEKYLPAAASGATVLGTEQRVHHPAKIPQRTEPAPSALAVLNCSTPARALSSSSFSSSSSSSTCTGAQAKPVPTLHEVATSSKHSMGWFGTLPAEMLHELFCLLDYRSLALISLTSKEMATAVLSYLQSADGLKRVMAMVFVGHVHSDPLEFRGVGKYSALFLLALSPSCA